MDTIRISTTGRHQVIDITNDVAQLLPGGMGVTTVFVQHTTVAITTADMDPGTDLDLLDFLGGLVPDRHWRHPHDPAHAPSHLLASMIGPSVSVPYVYGQLLLGTWQHIIMIEFDGPRERSVIVST